MSAPPSTNPRQRHTDAGLPTVHRILVIDDNEAIHGDFRKTLEPGASQAASDLSDLEADLFDEPAAPAARAHLCFQVDSALQGEEGHAKVLQAVRDGRPYSTAFVDMRMPPGWDGVETIENLWKADPELQVVICTAYSDYSWAEMMHRLGATDRLLILKKPFDNIEACQLATALTAKRLATIQARLKLSEMEGLVQAKARELRDAMLIDKLTGLPNRERLNDRLTQLIAQARRNPQKKFGLLFLDFDRFKFVNDSLGHAVGDMLLVEIARRLEKELRTGDTVAVLEDPDQGATTAARLGGDEFVVILDSLREHHDAARVAERLLTALSAPYLLRGHIVQSTASIGITTSAIGYAKPEEMIRDADTAMYRAKADGKGRCVVFDQKMHDDAMARLTLENDLRAAIQAEQLSLQYQPIVCLSDGCVSGFEALVRWKHPTRGSISPLEFIPIAEEMGMISQLGYWVLEQACRQLADWRTRRPELGQFGISVNLSRKQLASPDLIDRIARTLRQTGIEPQDLKLEITESTIMEDGERGVHVLQQIRDLGVQLHMDDFGTGYSSLSCLHRFPINGLKIDRSFVKSVSERREYAAVINAIIALTHNLDIQLVAEGVETIDQLVMLQTMGCDLAQGYYFARPLDAAAAEAFLEVRHEANRLAAVA